MESYKKKNTYNNSEGKLWCTTAATRNTNKALENPIKEQKKTKREDDEEEEMEEGRRWRGVA